MPTMKLADYLSQAGISRGAFAAMVGVSPSYVTLLCTSDKAWPGREIAARIKELTNGSVTPDDFLPSPQPMEAAQ